VQIRDILGPLKPSASRDETGGVFIMMTTSFMFDPSPMVSVLVGAEGGREGGRGREIGMEGWGQRERERGRERERERSRG